MTADALTPNRRTLLAYEQASDRYCATASPVPVPELAAFLDQVATLAPAGHVLELGSGPGIDALALEARGLTVRRTDATVAFVDRLRRDGFDADVLDALVDDLGGPYDAVLADAVLLHFSEEELTGLLHRAAVAAPVLAFTVKEGDGDLWTSVKLDLPRWFCFWREQPLRALLAATGWDVVTLRHHTGRSDDWLYVVARRR